MSARRHTLTTAELVAENRCLAESSRAAAAAVHLATAQIRAQLRHVRSELEKMRADNCRSHRASVDWTRPVAAVHPRAALSDRPQTIAWRRDAWLA